ncbi:MAG: rod shape-determining protein MreD [Eubacterium sp.]|nr:rod shape-determining protein MreD [Eubacterium sp.]
MTIKYTFYAVIIAVAALLQNVGGLWFEIGSARCFFIIPVAVLLSLGEDERNAALIGLFAGFLWDCVSVSHMGFNCIVLSLLCYVAAMFVNFVFRSTFWVNVISAATVTFIYCITYWIFIVLVRGGDGAALSFLNFYLPCFLYTSFAGLILTALLSPVKLKLNKGIIE